MKSTPYSDCLQNLRPARNLKSKLSKQSTAHAAHHHLHVACSGMSFGHMIFWIAGMLDLFIC